VLLQGFGMKSLLSENCYIFASLLHNMTDQDKIALIIERIVSGYDPEKIILFGSYAFGNQNSDSDVDLFVVKESDMPRPQRTVFLRKMLIGTGVPIDLVVYTPQEVEKSQNIAYSFVNEVIKKGKVVYERSKA
jgi:predicted nucleotidyltransferase